MMISINTRNSDLVRVFGYYPFNTAALGTAGGKQRFSSPWP